MIKKWNNYLLNKKGMSLVEVLTAMTILTLVIFCFAPLMLSYMDTINIAGDKMERVYKDAGNLEVLLGKNSLDGNYTVSLDTVPIILTSPDATITVDGNTQNVAAAEYPSFVKAYGLTSGGTFAKDKDGNPIAGGNINISTGQSTFYTDKAGSASGITLFPSSLTDDFKVAYITIYSADINFVLGQCEFVTTGPTDEIPLTEGEDYDLEYHPDRKNPTDTNILLLTVYGGGDKISFETSPLVFKHLGQRYEIQIDAPSMIMVGEKAPDDNYYYYVSRGELDEDGNLLIHRRTMETTDDPKGSGKIELTSAMNDVEWVSVESADDYAIDSSGEKYGYYVMCGDNGQIRRFWKRPSRTMVVDGKTVTVDGNYYWGGDYTYYTDYNLNRFSSGTYIKTKALDGKTDKADRNYSTNASFKYIAMRPMYWSEGSVPQGGLFSNTSAPNVVNKYRTGFNMSGKKYRNWINAVDGVANLRNLCTVSATYGDAVEFYGSDGLLFPYVTNDVIQVENPNYNPDDCDDNNDNQYMDSDLGSITNQTPSYEQIEKWQTSGGTFEGHTVVSTSELGLTRYSNEAWGWLDPGDGMISYYRINGLVDSGGNVTVDTTSYPITLTSVDAICITGSGGVYETNVTDTSKSHLFTSGVSKDADTSGDLTTGSNASGSTSASTNLEYPMTNYVLYCGYIPAYMDAWGGTTGKADYHYTVQFAGGDGQYAKVWETNANRNVGQYSTIGRASNRQQLGDNSEYNTIWRMTMGITPFYNGSLAWNKGQNQGHIGYQVRDGRTTTTVVYYPYTNLSYAITGKYYDQATYNQHRDEINALFPGVAQGMSVASPAFVSSPASDRQTSTTAGKVIDITISYLSHPLAISIAANPTDDIVYDLSNDKDSNQIFYWHNRRESITFLDSATTFVPSGENDISVSLMVGYVLGGTVLYGDDIDSASVDVTSVMNNGIVFIRAGEADIDRHGVDTSAISSLFGGNSANSMTGEYKAVDSTGYKLTQESNVFHQFYYLDTYTRFEKERSGSGAHNEYAYQPEAGKNIGNLYGAEYWQNNRHILNRSIYGGTPSNGTGESFEYLRAHPLADTKVNCVAWGVTWDGKPEAMWGTDNGTVLSWWVDTTIIQSSHKDYDWNSRSVDAEIQSYKWVDSVNGKTYKQTKGYPDSLGSAVWGSGNSNGTTYSLGSGTIPATFKYFCDKGTQATSSYATLGFINTLENINDIEFADDVWIAVGDQSDKEPADYSASGVEYQNNRNLKSNEHWQTIKAYSGTGRGGSWVNVRYWVDLGDNGKHSTNNATYHWRAVKISDDKNCNIVQINNVNGMWIATGYKDMNGNDEFDNGETTVISWTYDPLVPYGEEGGWSTDVKMYDGITELPLSAMGGINSCATRD